jgi:hypothetical protein
MSPGTPERIYFASIFALVVAGMAILVMGYVSEVDWLIDVGSWTSLVGIAFACLPLMGFMVLSVWEKWRGR